jgi:HPt (histidine-containing phosphotransfer) domain-containing protein
MDIKKDKRKKKNAEIRVFVENAQINCKDFFKDNYRYCDKEAIEELGLDSELINQLLEDYVIQIVKSIETFRTFLNVLKNDKLASKELDFTPLRELAHKNLGVARNLRIKDSEEILTTLMKSDDLEEIEKSLDILHSCIIKLKPESAYNCTELLKLKSKIS